MKKYSLIVLLLILIKSGWTQNSNLDYKYALKVYNLTSYEEYAKSKMLNDTSSYLLQYTTTTLQILHPTIAFQWQTSKNNFHEFELTSFMLRKLGIKTDTKNDTTNNGQAVSESDLTTTAISVRYEYILNFRKRRTRNLYHLWVLELILILKETTIPQ